MARGIGLACERCDFTATLSDRIPFSLDGSGEPFAVHADDPRPAAGYWSDGLCGACRLPVRTEHWNGAASDLPARCPHCGAEPLPFEIAVRELAAACHSRVWRDYAEEQAVAGAIEAALGEVPRLRAAVAEGESTTPDALDALAGRVTVASGAIATEELPEAAPATSGPAPIPTLVGLRPLIENALDLTAAASVLRERLQESEAHSAALRLCIEDEEYLPGVPCPKCEQGHLVHWPLWS